jgi:hypothetical protein
MSSKSKNLKKIEQAQDDVGDLLIDIRDDPIILEKLTKELEKSKDFTIGELAEMVPNLKKNDIVKQEALKTMAFVLINKDEKLQVLEYQNTAMSEQLSVRDKEKIEKATELYEQKVKENKHVTKSRLSEELRRAYTKNKQLTG